MHVENRGMSMLLLQLPIWAFCIIFGAFGVLLAGSIIIGAVGPKVWLSETTTAWGCPDGFTTFNPANCTGVDTNVNGTKWYGMMTGMSKLNQELDIYVTMENLHYPSGLSDDVKFVVTIRGSYNDDLTDPHTIIEEKHTTREISCSKGSLWCDEVILISLGFVQYTSYEFEIETPNLGAQLYFGDIKFEFKYVNPANTKYELWWRVFFLVVSFIALAVFFFFLRKFRIIDWTVEQKWTGMLLVVLIAYDNPVWPFFILVDGWFWVFINQLLTVNFLAVILLYWLVTFDELRKESQDHGALRFYLPKCIFIGVCWVLVIILYTWNQVHGIGDPTHMYSNDLGGYIFLAIVAVILLVAYIAWVGYYLFRSFVESKGLQFIGLRIKFFGLFTIFVMCGVIFLAIIAFLAPPFCENNGAKFLTTISLANLYVYVLTVVFLPSRDAHPDQWKTDKDKQQAVSSAFPEEHFDQVVDDPVHPVDIEGADGTVGDGGDVQEEVGIGGDDGGYPEGGEEQQQQ